MILTPDEYTQGFLDFDASIPPGGAINIWTKTAADDPNDPGEWTGPYSDRSGNKVLSLPKNRMRLRMELKRGPDPHATPILRKVRWDRDGLTYLFPGKDGWDGSPRILRLGRDYGCSYRIVLRPRKSTWKQPYVLLADGYRIRFWEAPLTGHRISGFNGTAIDSEGNSVIEGQVEEITSEGSVIEILATVPSLNMAEGREQAKAKVEAIAGILGVWGESRYSGKQCSKIFTFHHQKTMSKVKSTYPLTH